MNIDPASGNHGPHGMPDIDAVREMAKTWLECQSIRWPSQVEAMSRGGTREEAIDAMAESFRNQYGGVGPRPTAPAGAKTGLAYIRYSCDNSNPRSLAQQLTNVLQAANSRDHFIPWSMVFADANISGTTNRRPGYLASIEAVSSPGHGVDAYFADDMSRITRRIDETASISRSVLEMKKKIICASDGTEVSQDKSNLIVHFNGIMNEYFVEQLIQKVNRGMRDLFAQGGIMGKAPVGYKDVPENDENGNPKISHKKKVVHKRIIDECGANLVRRVFDLFVNEKKSAHTIVKMLNKEGLCGKHRWTDMGVMKLLTRTTYIGIEMWGLTKTSRNSKSGSVRQIRQPKGVALIRMVPHLRIVDDEIFKKAQDIIIEIKNLHQERKSTKTATPKNCTTMLHPSILVRPLCKHCNCPLVKGNSSRHTSMRCKNGYRPITGCKLTTYKSLRIIEEQVLSALKNKLLDSDLLNRILKEANEELLKLARQPKTDLKPLKAALDEVLAKIKNITNFISSSQNPPKALADQLNELEMKEKEIRERIKLLTDTELFTPEPITEKDLEAAMADLRNLLNERTGESAVILKEVLGNVYAEGVDEKSRRGTAWRLTFTVNGEKLMALLAAKSKSPTAATWEYLSRHGWSFQKNEELSVVASERRFNDEHIELAKQLREEGASIAKISRQLNRDYEYVKRLLDPNHRYRQKSKSPGEIRLREERLQLIASKASTMLAEGAEILQVARQLKTRSNIILKALEKYGKNEFKEPDGQ